MFRNNGLLHHNVIPYLFDCNPRLIKFCFRHFVRLIINGALRSRTAYIFLFIYLLSKGIDDAQSSLGYILSTKLSLSKLFSSELSAPSVTGGIMMNRRQL